MASRFNPCIATQQKIERGPIVNDESIDCAKCKLACPNEAISAGETIFAIDPERCTECVGHYTESQCMDVCPVDCIMPDPDYLESNEDLEAKCAKLTNVTA